MIAMKTRCHDIKHPCIYYHKHVFNPIRRSTAWWADKAKGLFAITEEGELGMMNSMVTTVDTRKIKNAYSSKSKQRVTCLMPPQDHPQRQFTRAAGRHQAETLRNAHRI